MSTLIGLMTLLLMHPASGEEQAFASGVAMLERAAESLGGEARIRALPGLTYAYDAAVLSRFQGPTPATPIEARVRQTAMFDLQQGRAHLINETTWGDTSFGSDRISEVAGDWAGHARELRLSPHALIHFALNNAGSVRALDANSVAVTVFGRTFDLDFDDAGRPQTARFWIDDVRHGDSLIESHFLDYREQGRWQVPGGIRQTEAGEEVARITFDDYQLAADIPAPPSRDEGPPRAAPEAPGMVELTRDATLFTRVGGADYHALVVETDQGLLVVEAPISPDASRGLRERIADHYGTDRIHAVTVTHHHADHASGLPGLVDAATVVHVPSDQQAYYADMLSAPRHLVGFDHEPVAEPRFSEQTGFTLNSGGSARIIDVGTEHARHHAIVVVEPAAGPAALFQGDMLVFTHDGGVEPARDQGCRLVDAMADLKLQVAVVAGAHGRPGDLADVERAVEARESPCP